MKVYLGGPIAGCTDEEAKDWRNHLKKILPSIEFSDPMDRDFREVDGDHTEVIVEGDLDAIDSCDVLLANCWKIGWGTGMEIMYASRWADIKILTIVPPEHPISPWLTYHCDYIARSMEDAIETLKNWELTSHTSVEPDDPVNHPSHYTAGKIEIIDFIEDQNLGYHLGNTVKYICRAGKKTAAPYVQDLKKARWYLDRKIRKTSNAVRSNS